MIAELADLVPASLAPSCQAMRLGCPPGCPRACRLAEPTRFDSALSAFAALYDEADRGALVSLWSMYYFAALMVPATAAILCRDHILPVGFEEVGIAIAPQGTAAFMLPGAGTTARPGHRFDTLVDGHLAPFVTLCASRADLSPRVFWSNAAVMLDWALGELEGADTMAAARAEAGALLDGSLDGRLARPMRNRSDGSRMRRVCCLRYRLPGIAHCGALCPRGRRGVGCSSREGV